MSTASEIYTELLELKTRIGLEEISELDIACKSTIHRFLSNDSALSNISIIKIDAVLDYTYERINIGNWKDVKPYLRKTMTIASYIKLIASIKSIEPTSHLDVIHLQRMYKIIDHGLMFGCPIQKEPQLLQKCATILNKHYCEQFTDMKLSSSAQNQDEIQNIDSRCHQGKEIDVVDCPSMEYFYKEHILTQKPVVLTNCIQHWPALTKWTDQNYLLKLAGLRTVPVELGSKYTDAEWTQKLMTLGDFIKQHIFTTEGPTGYLAQYQLFDHISELKNDICEPEYCCFSDTNDPVDINAWFGPKGTVSPLHHDPKKNLLAQVVGEKRIYLFSPSDSEFLYPHDDELLNNTARVDPRCPDLELYPKYKDAKPQICILKPGQMLYIPPKWWHFVESLSISFSVSFWWE
ncbi:bifunctional peptidase and arginyl-hydroxylase JMJD5 [Plutella xylostella]|uniref:bifunctional peptidase and arginyl-hydroxylase JMJD5 n=1 Tax=Plutella xylostella TaxID=51655 RepID=UPI0020325224|nr:bifunctional peptidase and arginyl-hydroxylase JMJD5 [Plutella xylostella]